MKAKKSLDSGFVVDGEKVKIRFRENKCSKAREKDGFAITAFDSRGGRGVGGMVPGKASGENGKKGSSVGRDMGENRGGRTRGGAEDAKVVSFRAGEDL